MGAGRGGHPLLLLVALALAARLGQPQRWGGFQEKSTSAKNMNSTLAFYMDAYNNKSNDSYLFRVDKLLRSQVQLTTGVEYLVTVRISRTKCKRNDTGTRPCPVQSKNKLKKIMKNQDLNKKTRSAVISIQLSPFLWEKAGLCLEPLEGDVYGKVSSVMYVCTGGFFV